MPFKMGPTELIILLLFATLFVGVPLVVAVMWKPARVAMGVVMILFGLILSATIIGMIIGIPAIFGGVIFLVTGLREKRAIDVKVQVEKPESTDMKSVQTPLDIAKARYARGEISHEQFEQLKRDLGG